MEFDAGCEMKWRSSTNAGVMGCTDLTAHLGLPGDFSVDKGLLQQVAQVSKLENNP